MSASQERTEIEDQERGTAHIVTVAHVLSAWEQEAGKGNGKPGKGQETGNRKP